MFKETATRSVVKALSWRVLATLTTAVLVFTFTRRLDIAVTVGILESIAKMFLYFAHERVWNKLEFGRAAVVVVPQANNLPATSSVEQTAGERDSMTF